MNAAERAVEAEVGPKKRRAYDPNSLDPIDAEARKYDDTSEGIDWDEIIATTQDDEEAERFAFDSDVYATDEEVSAALDRHLSAILDRVVRRVRDETAAARSLDRSRG